jgi:hypothetical protein
MQEHRIESANPALRILELNHGTTRKNTDQQIYYYFKLYGIRVAP